MLAHMDLMTFYGHIKFDTGQDFGLQTGHEMVYSQWQKATDTGALQRTMVWPEEAAISKPFYPKP